MSSLYKKSEVQKRHTSYYIEPPRPSLVANYQTRSTIGFTKRDEFCNSQLKIKCENFDMAFKETDQKSLREN